MFKYVFPVGGVAAKIQSVRADGLGVLIGARRRGRSVGAENFCR